MRVEDPVFVCVDSMSMIKTRGRRKMFVTKENERTQLSSCSASSQPLLKRLPLGDILFLTMASGVGPSTTFIFSRQMLVRSVLTVARHSSCRSSWSRCPRSHPYRSKNLDKWEGEGQRNINNTEGNPKIITDNFVSFKGLCLPRFFSVIKHGLGQLCRLCTLIQSALQVAWKTPHNVHSFWKSLVNF